MFIVSVTICSEGNLFAIRRPCGPGQSHTKTILGQLPDIPAVRIHQVDFTIPVAVGRENNLFSPRRLPIRSLVIPGIIRKVLLVAAGSIHDENIVIASPVT